MYHYEKWKRVTRTTLNEAMLLMCASMDFGKASKTTLCNITGLFKYFSDVVSLLKQQTSILKGNEMNITIYVLKVFQ